MEIIKPDIALVLLNYGLDVTDIAADDPSWHSITCPFHDDSSPSARVNRQENRFQCFVCDGYSGDSITIIEKAEGLGFRDALEWARDNLGYEGGEVREAARPRQYRPSWQGEDC